MKKAFRLLFSIMLVLGLAGVASAGTSHFGGTLNIRLGTLPAVDITGIGVATINQMQGGTHVTSITLPSPTLVHTAGSLTLATGLGIHGSGVIPITDPEGINDNGIISVRITATVGGGDLVQARPTTMIHLGGSTTITTTPVSNTFPTVNTPLTNNDLGLANGLVRLCILFPDCSFNVALDLDATNGTGVPIGVGLGGQLTVGGSGTLRISIDAAPWTILTASVVDQPDNPANGTVSFSGATNGTTANYTIKTAQGFAHGPGSKVSTVALGTASGNYGVVQFVTPTQVTTNITSTSSLRIGTPISLIFRFVPEPGLLLLLGSGVVGLVVLGRHRMRK